MPFLSYLASFSGSNGSGPGGALIADQNGDLFGTTYGGGAGGYGTVFELVHTGGGYAAAPTTLVTFTQASGYGPQGNLLIDASGNLYGTVTSGGTGGGGGVFEIAKASGTATGYATAATPLTAFDAVNGYVPTGGLIADAKGNLFGTTSGGGPSSNGTVFEIAKDGGTASGFAKTPTTIATFGGTNGSSPFGTLYADASGNLFGTTQSGGAFGSGTVFEIAKSAGTATGYAATPTPLASFNGTNGGNPYGALVADAKGNLYGTGSAGGPSGLGVIFELAKDPLSPTGFATAPTTLADGGNPAGTLIIDANGNLFGGTGGFQMSVGTVIKMVPGTVFELAKDSGTSTGYATATTTLASFTGSDGISPFGGILADASGNLYGVTEGGGSYPKGSVFEITGTGFVTCFASGTRIRTSRGEIPVEALRVGDLAMTASGSERPIRWIGHRTIDCRHHPHAGEIVPVRVAAHAFGDARPTRDLFLSPGHPVLVGADEDGAGGYLVPIMCLINGTTILRHTVETVTYWHVELDEHDILLAEGLPTESYLDWGDRGFFAESADHALRNPDFIVPGLAGRCRPVAIDGPVVKSERQRLDGMFAMRLAKMSAWPSEDVITAF